MKRFFALLILICISLSLISCSSKYEPVPSTEAEKRVVMTLSAYGESYEVKYELWRAFYLTYKDDVSGEGEEYRKNIDALVLDRIIHVYSVLALCDKLGINLYSRSVNKEIEDYVAQSVEGAGGSVGYGSYEEYLSALKKMNLNYSVQDLLFRYEIGLREIDEYYIGTFDADKIQDGIKFGDISYTREDVKSYYYSDACVRVLRAHLQAGAYYNPDAYALEVKEEMEAAALTGESAVATVIINTGLTAPIEVERGYVIAKNNLEKLYYSEMTESAFELEIGEVSEPITVNYGDGEVIFILYRAEKSDEHFDESYTEIAYVYLTDAVGGYLASCAKTLFDSVELTGVLDTIDYNEVFMND